MLQPNVDNAKAQISSSAGLEGLRRERENLQPEVPRLEDGLASCKDRCAMSESALDSLARERNWTF